MRPASCSLGGAGHSESRCCSASQSVRAFALDRGENLRPVTVMAPEMAAVVRTRSAIVQRRSVLVPVVGRVREEGRLMERRDREGRGMSHHESKLRTGEGRCEGQTPDRDPLCVRGFRCAPGASSCLRL